MKRLIYIRLAIFTSVLVVGAVAAALVFLQGASLTDALGAYLPVLAAMVGCGVGCALLVARGIAAKLAAQINTLEPGNTHAFWDELSPLAHKLAALNRQVDIKADEARRAELIYMDITEQMKEGLVLLDSRRRIVFINSSALALFGLANQNIIGRNILALTRSPELREHAKQALSGEASNITMQLGQRSYQVLFSAAQSGALILFLDISERTEAEHMRREFSANVSHELKTPLTTIMGYSELIRAGLAEPSAMRGFGEKIMNESRRLVSLIDEIMLLSKLDEGEHRLSKEDWKPCELCEIADQVMDALSAKALQRGIELRLHCDGCVDILANETMLYNMLLNIVDNGIKYNKDGGVVEISIFTKGSRVQISVRDTGIGIPAASISRVFERFYTVDKSRSRRNGGTGLGLSIVKRIVNYHGGSVEVSSSQGEWTRVDIALDAVEQ